MEELGEKPRLRSLLDHFSAIEDEREQWRVAHPLPEVLLLAVCGTIASCDDFEDIVEWGEAHLDFLRRFLPYHHGIVGARWLNILMNRMDPDLFRVCFEGWVRERWPDAPEQIALDGKVSRRSHDWAVAKDALHLVSAFATHERLVLGQEPVDGHGEQGAIPILLRRLAGSGALTGAVVTIDAIACNPAIAREIIDGGADYVLAVKDNQPSLCSEIASFFDDPQTTVETHAESGKGHGRIETRRASVSHDIDWLRADRAAPGEPRFKSLTLVGMVERQVETKGKTSNERHFYIASRPMTAADFARAVRSHWAIENSLHWVLDVQFKDDLSRVRKGHGAKNMAVVRHFAINLVRVAKDKRSIKTRRKRASWNPEYLASLIDPPR